MARPPSDLKPCSVLLSPADLAAVERIGRALEITRESRRGRPSASAVIRHLIRDAARRLDRREGKSRETSE